MIEGLKVTIRAAELGQLCRDQSAFHMKRVAAYSRGLEALSKDELEGLAHYSWASPVEALNKKRKEHQEAADEMAFVAAATWIRWSGTCWTGRRCGDWEL